MISTHYNSTIVNIKYTTFGIASAEVTTFAWSWDTDSGSALTTIHECLLVKDALTDKNAYLRLLGFVNKCGSQEGEATMGMSLMCVQPVCDCSNQHLALMTSAQRDWEPLGLPWVLWCPFLKTKPSSQETISWD